MQFFNLNLRKIFNLLKILVFLIIILSCAWFLGQKIAGLKIFKADNMSQYVKQTMDLTHVDNLNYKAVFVNSITLLNSPTVGQDKGTFSIEHNILNEDNLKNVFQSEIGVSTALQASNNTQEATTVYNELEEEYIPELEGDFLPEPFVPEEPKNIH